MKTTNISKTKPNETKAWIRSFFMLSGTETNQADSTAHRAVSK